MFNLGLNLGLGSVGSAGALSVPASGYVQWLDLGISGGAFTTVSDRIGVLDAASIVAGELVQTDAFFTSGAVSFYSADGASIDSKTHTQLLAHYNSINGGDNLWVRVSVDGLLAFAVQYPLDFAWTPTKYLQNIGIFGGTPVIPAQPVENGIGPNGDWFTYDGTHIILVEDA